MGAFVTSFLREVTWYDPDEDQETCDDGKEFLRSLRGCSTPSTYKHTENIQELHNMSHSLLKIIPSRSSLREAAETSSRFVLLRVINENPTHRAITFNNTHVEDVQWDDSGRAAWTDVGNDVKKSAQRYIVTTQSEEKQQLFDEDDIDIRSVYNEYKACSPTLYDITPTFNDDELLIEYNWS